MENKYYADNDKIRETRFLDKLMIFFMNRGFRFRLVALFACISLLPLTILGLFSYNKASNTIKEITIKYSSDIVKEVNTNMRLQFQNINDIGKVLLNNADVMEMLTTAAGVDGERSSEDNLKMSILLKMIKDSNDNISSVYILSEKNNSIFAVGDITEERGMVFLNKEYRQNYKKSDLYKKTISVNKNIWWPTQPVLGRNVFILTEKLYNKDHGVLGVLVVHMDVAMMDIVYHNIRMGKDSVAYLVSPEGRILFHPQRSEIGKLLTNKEILNQIGRSDESNFIIDENSKAKFVVFNTLPINMWKLVVITDYQELIADANKIRDVSLITSLACLVFVIIFSIFVSKSILNPVYKLIGLMEKGSAGDMKVRFNTLYNDEIGQLGNSFNKMMVNIESLIKMVESESNKKVEAEIKVLESQINPHFLYNTLASIYWNAMASGNSEIGKMSASLSKFFKLGLNKGKEFTTVENEVEHVTEYLSIQRMMYPRLFDFQVDVEPDTLKYKTIKLILQPLVENAIYHGMEKREDKGFVKIEVSLKDERVFFRVKDNGAGIDQANNQNIMDFIETGFGLKNIRQRLKLYFNDDFEFHCTSSPNVETIFTISIPARI